MAIGQLASTGKQDGSTPSTIKMYRNIITFTATTNNTVNIQIDAPYIINSMQQIEDLVKTTSGTMPFGIITSSNDVQQEVTSGTLFYISSSNRTLFSCFVNGTRIVTYLDAISGTIYYNNIEY